MKFLGLITHMPKEFTDLTCYLALFRAIVCSQLEYCSVLRTYCHMAVLKCQQVPVHAFYSSSKHAHYRPSNKLLR